MAAQVTREAWLEEAVKLLRPVFKARGYEIPKKVRVSVGWPLGRRTAIGQCFGDHMSADGTHEMFISPELADPLRILDVLVHELIHACVGVKEGHNKVFTRAARLLDLEGKPTATVGGDAFAEWAKPLIKRLPKLRHASLKRTGRGMKKQSTRMIKVECPCCGYVARTTRKWLDVGLPLCPDGSEMQEEDR